MKVFLFLSFLFCTTSLYAAGVVSEPVYESAGKDWRPINVAQSSSNVVLISSAAANSNLNIGQWKSRLIINMSTSSALALFPNNTTFTTYTSSFSIVLSSDSSGLGQGDSWLVTHQGAVYGIWTNAIAEGGQGAGGYESYDR